MKKTVRNAVALDLASRKYALRIVAKAKGKGSYRRNRKHRTWNDGGASSVLATRSRWISHCGRNWAFYSLRWGAWQRIVQGQMRRRCR
jgi:Domain of unknown function.